MQTIQDWHARFQKQAKWTEEIISYSIRKADLSNKSKILEIGCGTGAMIEKFPKKYQITGLDIDFPRVSFANANVSSNIFVVGNGNSLPLSANSFDFVFCHFLLLWVENAKDILAEMKRITKPSGWMAVLAEPDYANRVDEPIELKPLGVAQTNSLKMQGANPNIGSELPSLISGLNLENLELGIYENNNQSHSEKDWSNEWKILALDLEKSNFPGSLEKYKAIDEEARKNKERKLLVPTHFAIGQKGEF